jgi:hypothetical protein
VTDRSPELPSERRARHLLAIGSWAIVATYAFALLTIAIPPLYRLSQVGQPLGPIVGGIVGVALTVGILGTWIPGVWHAAVHSGFLTEGQRVVVILLLLIPMAGMFYYFGYVCWRHRAHVRSEAV